MEGGPGSDLGLRRRGRRRRHRRLLGQTRPRTRRYTTDRIGGAGAADGADEIRGDGGPDAIDGDDLVAGDNALPTRVAELATRTGYQGPPYVLQLHDVADLGTEPDPATNGGDTIDGDGGTDRLFGQGGADTVNGDAGDDYLEGNDGGDTITGGTGADDVVGGSSRPTAARWVSPATGSSRRSTGRSTPRRPGCWTGGSTRSAPEPARTWCWATTAGSPALGAAATSHRPGRRVRHRDDVSDEDHITSGADGDRVFGQGGNDLIDAGSEGDHVEGNEGADGLIGGAGPDVIIGGSSLSPDNRGSLDDALDRARTQLDGNDNIHGDLPGSGAVASDLVFGDNATVLRLESGLFVTQLADVATHHWPDSGQRHQRQRHDRRRESRLTAPVRPTGSSARAADDTISTGPVRGLRRGQ